MKTIRAWGLALLAAAWTFAAHADVEERAAIDAAFKSAFNQGSFAQVEKDYAAAVATGRRLPSGLFWSNGMVRGMFSDPPYGGHGRLQAADAPLPKIGADDHWEPIEQKAARWVASSPDSVLPVLAQAQAHLGHAWSYRGGGYASTVSEEGWSGFYREVSKAQKALLGREALGRKDPNWWDLVLTVAKFQGMARADYHRLARSAMDAFPANYDIYFQVAQSLLPQWGGSLQALAALADDAVQRTRATEGESLYARIYWSAEGSMGGDFLKHPAVDWKRVRAGFEDMLKRYPDAWNANAYARMSCLAGDKSAARSAFAHMKERVVPSQWRERAIYQRCAAFAAS